MKRGLVVIAFFFNLAAFAQHEAKHADSLLNIINTTASPSKKAQALVLYSDEFSVTNLDTMPLLCFEALSIVKNSPLENKDIEKRPLRIAESDAYNNLGFYHIMKGNLDSALTYLTKAKVVADESNHLEGLQSIGINTAIVLGEQGKYKESIKILEQDLKLVQHLDNKQQEATILNNIGWIYQVLKKFDIALTYYTAAYHIHKKNSDQIKTSIALNNIGVAHSGLGNNDSAFYYYQAAFDIREVQNDVRGMSNSYSNLGGTYLKMGDTVSAKNYFIKSLEICRKNDFKRLWINILNALGKLAISQNDLVLAQSCVTEIDSLLPYYNTPVSQLMLHQIQHQVAAKSNNWQLAYNSLDAYKNVLDSSRMKTVGNELIAKELELEAEKEKAIVAAKHKNEQALLSAEKERISANLYFTIGLCVLLGFALLYIIKFFKQKEKMGQMQLELTRLKNEKLQVEMGQKNKELTGFSLRVAQNNQFLENVDEIITQVNSSTKEEIEDDLRKLKNEIKTSKRREKDWLEFQRQFEGIHTSFIQNLTQKHPKLTAKEIRLCTLMKLNLPSKDICSVLGISTNTLKSARYRIHKKMELAPGLKLAEYILKLN